MLNVEQCWLAVQNRDATQDGRFFYGVITTGVYCRPSCPSRRPLIKNVRFYETTAEAERDGLRPCLRCRPTSDSKVNPSSERVGQVCRYIESPSDESLKLDELAALVGMNRFHLQRVFKSAVGTRVEIRNEAPGEPFAERTSPSLTHEGCDLPRRSHPNDTYDLWGRRRGSVCRDAGRWTSVTRKRACIDWPGHFLVVGNSDTDRPRSFSFK
jgi:hypothetical protein